jgi:beta-glucosidase
LIRWSLALLASIALAGFTSVALGADVGALTRALPKAQSQRLSRGVERLASTGYVSGIPSLRIPALVMADATTTVASPMAVAASWDGATAYAYGAALGRSARAEGIDVLGLSLGEYGSEPLLAARLAPGLVRGVQSAHVVAAVVGRGGGATDVRTLRERDLPPVVAAVQNGAGAVACSSRAGSAAAICADRRLLASILTREVRFLGFAIGNPYDDLATPARIVSTLSRVGALAQSPRDPFGGEGRGDGLSRRIVQSGAVLLKNDAAVLPLDPAALSSLALVGADPQTQAALAAVLPRTKILPIVAGDLAAAVSAAHRAEATIVVLGPQADPDESQLIAGVVAVNPRTAVVLERSPDSAPDWASGAPALLLAWAPSSGTPVAVANLIAGQANPCGKLPIALPAAAGSSNPGFAFGDGLSYTAFAYSDLTVSYGRASDPHPVIVHFTVRNTGKVGGTEIAQLYLGAPAGGAGASKALVGFVRLALPAGQTRTLAIPLGVRSFATWSPSYKAWYVAPGNYVAMVGDGSESIRLTGEIRIVGR